MRPVTARPGDLLCLLCSVGAGNPVVVARSGRHARKLRALMAAVRNDPARPVRLRCTVDSLYAYQNPRSRGALDVDDLRRDLHVLQRLGLVPGDTRPALELFRRALESLTSVEDLCAPACPHAAGNHYAAAREAGLGALVGPRSATEMARAKTESARAMEAATILSIRPHHLMCMACFHGGREELAPIPEDNLFEAIDVIRKRPEIPVALVKGCCMVCPPCPSYERRSNRCIGDIGMSLRDEKKDLDVLALIGLGYGATVPARELYRLLFERISSTRQICGHGDGVLRGREWRVCGGPDGDLRYVRARECGMGIPGVAGDRA